MLRGERGGRRMISRVVVGGREVGGKGREGRSGERG